MARKVQWHLVHHTVVSPNARKDHAIKALLYSVKGKWKFIWKSGCKILIVFYILLNLMIHLTGTSDLRLSQYLWLHIIMRNSIYDQDNLMKMFSYKLWQLNYSLAIDLSHESWKMPLCVNPGTWSAWELICLTRIHLSLWRYKKNTSFDRHTVLATIFFDCRSLLIVSWHVSELYTE